MYLRTYVQVSAIFDENGVVTPVSISLRGKTYSIDRVLGKRPAPALKSGGQGIRYTVRIGSSETYLFLDAENRWFVEEKAADANSI